MTSTRCAVCNEPRADHGFTAVAGLDGKLGPWHEYTPPEPVGLRSADSDVPVSDRRQGAKQTADPVANHRSESAGRQPQHPAPTPRKD